MSTIKSFRTDARGGGDLDNMPNIVTFAVDENLAREIASLAEFVASHAFIKSKNSTAVRSSCGTIQ